MDTRIEDRDLLKAVVCKLVDDPEHVEIEEQRHNGESRMFIRVAPEDRGRVIGKGGETVQSLRVLFGRIAAVTGRKIFIHVDEAVS